MKFKLLIALLTYVLVTQAFSMSFNDAVEIIKNHQSVKTIEFSSNSLLEQSKIVGSWGDPIVKVAAKNYPKKSLKADESPMTGVEFGLSQKISLTNKYGYLKSSTSEMAQAKQFEASDKLRQLLKGFWSVLAMEEKINSEISLLNENLTWLDKIIRVSKKLYSTGKVSQRVLLDLQIRRSELSIALSNKEYDLKQNYAKIEYYIGERNRVNLATVPWRKLYNASKNKNDYVEKSLVANVNARRKQLTAAKLNYIPDLTMSLGITKRQYEDKNGDMVGLSISFPLPFSSMKYASHTKSIKEKYSSIYKLEEYKRRKTQNINLMSNDLLKIKNELKVIEGPIISFAKSSRKLASKTYALGNATYSDLLQSELKLQSILLKQVDLQYSLRVKTIELKYLTGESLNG